MRSVLVTIKGRVQGVAYRDWTQRRAETLGLGGWVRNRRDGSVEALFSGSDEAVAGMIEACRQGPPMADVAEVRIVSETEAPEYGFTVLPTR